ncbi:type II secretion system F family protein [Iodobacter fluviatilis]|uniref:Cholera toxin secretion protein epsF n=1 Tax=Iodobacter fluviatilis TaxID=537 RepID=A0A377SVE3_9NEIS|nr:type II secretion system F family protein [Iodobacter fluviatilis]TCU85595.1 type IV pilus assembly protein PilC [Iodobacter fluviatilis]STR44957.1 Cholera toxin secretion protein epsF [Iodobacter fluviatilis]
MQFTYRAADNAGLVQKGKTEANNLTDLEQRLERIGLSLITAKAASPGGGLGGKKVSRRELITFTFHMEQLTRAGVSILEGLSDLRDSLEEPRFREVIANLIEDIEGGQQFSQALAGHPQVFDAIYVNLIRAGEASGKLPEVLLNLSDSLKWQDELVSQTKKIVMYPAFVGVLVVGVITFLMIYLVPQLVSFVAAMQQTLPLNTRILIAVSNIFIYYWWALFGTPIILLLLFRLRLRHDARFRHRFDGWKLTIPPFGPILHKIILARFANFFALMYAAGIPILDCIKISEGIVSNSMVAESLQRIQAQIREGQGVTASFNQEKMFPPLVLRMLKVGESTGQLDHALMNVSYFYNRDVKESIERVQALIEPSLTVVLGLILAWIMSSVLGPIFDTISKLR